VAIKETRAIRDVEAVAERPDGSRLYFMPYPTPLRDDTGKLVGAVNMLVDITTRKQAEERMLLLTQEVDHRANNLLAVIQAMLRLTKAETAEEFQAAFQGRLSALANVQRLFSVSRWSGASLKTIVEEELRPYGVYDEKRVSIAGSDIKLPAALAQAIAVSVHELATNAAKYGSLSEPSGRVDIQWQTDEADNLLLLWKESGGPNVAEPARKGFGVGAIDGVIRTLSGRISRQWKPEGPICELCFRALWRSRIGLRDLFGAQPGILQPFGKPGGQGRIDGAADIDFRRRDIGLRQRQEYANPAGEPDMWIGQSLKLVLIVLKRLMIACLPHLDRQQAVGNFPLVYDDVGIDRFAEMVVGRRD
jgi:two-component sensor histidine kinase